MKITYDTPQGEFHVRSWQHTDEVTFSGAKAAAILLHDSYIKQFVQIDAKLTKQAVKTQFKLDDASIHERCEHMRKAIGAGSQYHYIVGNAADPQYRWLGLLMTSPSRANLLQRMRLASPNCYINDIVVAPDAQDSGIATMLLHKAMKFGGYEADNYVAGHAMTANAIAMSWFQSFGARVVPNSQGLTAIGDGVLEHKLLSTQPTDITVQDVFERLEAQPHRDYLARAGVTQAGA